MATLTNQQKSELARLEAEILGTSVPVSPAPVSPAPVSPEPVQAKRRGRPPGSKTKTQDKATVRPITVRPGPKGFCLLAQRHYSAAQILAAAAKGGAFRPALEGKQPRAPGVNVTPRGIRVLGAYGATPEMTLAALNAAGIK